MDNGWTPSHCAAESGRIHILRALHNANIRLDEKDDSGDTPLDIAKMYAHNECVKFLQRFVDIVYWHRYPMNF